jgi:uncharacterized membrane protein YkoI
MKVSHIAGVLVLAGALAVHSAGAQVAAAAKPMKEAKPGMLARARVTPDSARKLALAQVANGVIDEQEIEQEHGKLVYSFDIKVAGRSGIEEIQIDALSGAMVSHEHETPRQSAQERAADARAAAKKPARP